MDTTRLSDREIGMLVRVIFNKRWFQFKLHLVSMMLNIQQTFAFSCFVDERDIKSMFHEYNTSGRFSRTFLGDSFAVVCHDEIEMIHGILRNG